jgi:hypothetical protein
MDSLIAAANNLIPRLLYRIDGNAARFATWRLAEGHETLVLFTTGEAAEKYRGTLDDAASWTVFQPPRDKLIDILQTCRSIGIFYAALDPLNGSAKTLFDIPRVLVSAESLALNPER